MAIDSSASAYPKRSKHVQQYQQERKILRTGASFRAAVWMHDGGICRATRVPLTKDHEDHKQRGEVAHLESRGSHPDRKYDVTNGILLSAWAHYMSDGRGGKLLRLTDPETGLPAIDSHKKIRFTFYEPDGRTVRWTRIG